MSHKDSPRTLVRRHAQFPPAIWAVILDGLCSDAQLRTLTQRYLRPLPNRPLPKDRAWMIGALIPPPTTPHNLLAGFISDLLTMAPPGPAAATPEAVRHLLDQAQSSQQYASVLWACVCGADEAVAQAAVEHAVRAIGVTEPERAGAADAQDVADAVVRALAPLLRAPGPRDDSAKLLGRLEQARTEVHGLRGKLDGAVADITRSVRELATRPAAAGADRVADAVAARLSRYLETAPAWAEEALRRLGNAEQRIEALASDTLSTPGPRAQRDAWRLAHPAAPPRIALVADLENLTSSAREWRGRRLNFAAVYERLGRGGTVVSAAAFAVETPGQAAFLAALRHAGWAPHVRSTTTAAGRPKANWDVGLTLHVVDLAPRVDIVGLATGDGDFADLLQWLRAQGIQTRVAAVPEDTADKIRVAADEFIPVDEAMMMPGDAHGRERPTAVAAPRDGRAPLAAGVRS